MISNCWCVEGIRRARSKFGIHLRVAAQPRPSLLPWIRAVDG